MLRNLLYACLTVLLFSCSTDSESTQEDPPQSQDPAADETAPVISLSGLPDLLEVLTEINISITDASEDVTTTISLDNQELYQGNEKQISLNINPFDFDAGTKTLRISATDDSGNTEDETSEFELRKLLLKFPKALRGTETALASVYLAINDLDGKLITYQEIETNDEAVFYADDEFEEQNFTFTVYTIAKEPQSFQFISSRTEISPGTTIPDPNEVTEGCTERSGGIGTTVISLDIASNFRPQLRSYHAVLTTTNGMGPFNLNYHAEEEPFYFIYSFPLFLTPPDQYEYFLLEDLDQTNFNLSDFQKPVTTQRFTVPAADWLNLVVHGYRSEEDYTCNKFHEILDVLAVEDQTGGELDAPEFDFFPVYSKEIILNYSGGRQYTIRQKGLGRDIADPDVDMLKSGEMVNFTGKYQQAEFLLEDAEMLPSGTLNFFSWRFRAPEKETRAIPFFNFEFPEEVSQELESKAIAYDPRTAAIDSYFCFITAYETEPSYTDLFLNPVLSENERGDFLKLSLDLSL
ncbi:hypothetical protein [Poritiphilus flavus]|uniref:Lipoprotein n=1 Tax=Poritiphilus flavus TaxID=2697053 RepID=A0A6L9E7K7_9FLAO|nr:hypothetical protein [Poritiphilus flavus]NAS10439.1 hypothetical protein [Poritiphilus flavus]